MKNTIKVLRVLIPVLISVIVIVVTATISDVGSTAIDLKNAEVAALQMTNSNAVVIEGKFWDNMQTAFPLIVNLIGFGIILIIWFPFVNSLYKKEIYNKQGYLIVEGDEKKDE